MSSNRKNTIFVDFGVLPARPPLDSVKAFVEKSMGLEPAGIKCLQLHNTRNGVLIEMADPATATKAAADNNLKHTIRSGEKCFRIPIYVDDNAVDVRVHDLPPGMPNNEIADGMAQYGEVLTITDDVWKNFFPGIPNGVRVLRMKLSKPVPSYVSIKGQLSLATHAGQTPTCRRCGQKSHPEKTCSSVKPKKKTAIVNNKKQDKPATTPIVPAATTTTVPDPISKVTDDDGFRTVEKKGKSIKRQLSIDSKTTPQDKRTQINFDSETEMDEQTLRQISKEDSAKLRTDNFMKWCEFMYMN
ncbi:uncharacterized protein LOC120418310 [Culex pipiens pallens]|uniref:uncharacterized protein LOC120418310 n=1 Tax=Culex pipiens pallens TaxID=42434 RepID=UPI001952E68A|nr:uncharacterized protein LOC120418310 [Culex pipiens pallens]